MRAILLTLCLALASCTSSAMSPEHMKELAATASKISGYPLPEKPSLTLLIVKQEVISAIACDGRAQCPVLGLYQDQNVIFVVEGYSELDTDVILLHEMVHWLQHNSGEWAPVTEATSQEKYVREIEAHGSDQEYLLNYQHRCRGDNKALGDFCEEPSGVIGQPEIHHGTR